MLWSGSKPLTVVRENMWGCLMFAGVAWLVISWCVLRLEPTDVADVAGPVVLFGALTEAVRALAGTRTWWLNAGLAVLFAATGIVLMAAADQSSYTTPAALLGWFLMVRGAADVAASMMTRETDRIWGLLMVIGVLETGLGFFAASPLARTADLVVTVLAGLALARGLADLVASLRLREVSPVRPEVLELPPERAAGVSGYSAGLSDYESAPAAARVRTGPRHRAAPRSTGGWSRGSGVTAAGMSDLSTPVGRSDRSEAGSRHDATSGSDTGSGGSSFHDEVLRTTADLDAMLALAGVTGAGVAAGMAEHYHDLPEVPDTPEGAMPADTAEIPAVGEQQPEEKDADPQPRAAGSGDDTAIIAGGRLID
jgi:hypothetical protein